MTKVVLQTLVVGLWWRVLLLARRGERRSRTRRQWLLTYQKSSMTKSWSLLLARLALRRSRRNHSRRALPSCLRRGLVPDVTVSKPPLSLPVRSIQIERGPERHLLGCSRHGSSCMWLGRWRERRKCLPKWSPVSFGPTDSHRLQGFFGRCPITCVPDAETGTAGASTQAVQVNVGNARQS